MGVEKPIGFSTGREFDKETGLYYYRARYYDPMEGRFISKDPISFNGGDANLYGYVLNNPVNLTDPRGLMFGFDDAAAAYGAWAGLAAFAAGFWEWWQWITHPPSFPPSPPKQPEWRKCPTQEPKFATRPKPTVTAPAPPPEPPLLR